MQKFSIVLYVLYYLLGQISTGRRRCTGSGGRDIPQIIWWIFPSSQTARTAAGGSSILIRYSRIIRIRYDAVGNRIGSTCSGANCLYLGPAFAFLNKKYKTDTEITLHMSKKKTKRFLNNVLLDVSKVSIFDDVL
jgi:hypothetical protein